MASINNEKVRNIRIRFEYGEDLNKLSIEYKIPLSTVNKRKKRDAEKLDPWIKGCRSKISYQEDMTLYEKDKDQLCKIIDKKARERLEHLDKLLSRRESVECEVLDKDLEEAYIKRTNLINNLLETRRKIERIYTEPEQLDIEKRKLEIDMKKLEIEDKQIEIRLKKKEAELFLGGS